MPFGGGGEVGVGDVEGLGVEGYTVGLPNSTRGFQKPNYCVIGYSLLSIFVCTYIAHV
jgi:hypothetical protein